MMRGAPTAKPASPAREEEDWEVRPGGMLVQKRSPDGGDHGGDAGKPLPAIRIKVKHNDACHELFVDPQASFGEVKKMLAARTGLHPEEQTLVYKDRPRDSKAFLDAAGVRDRSKMVLSEDATAKARRRLEQRRAEKAERAARSVARIGVHVDKLGSKVMALEAIVSKGGKVVDADVAVLTEALMNEMVRLDSVVADGEVKEQKRAQEKKVQKYVETLDAIKVKNGGGGGGTPVTAGSAQSRAQQLPPRPPKQKPPAPQPASPAPAQRTMANMGTFDLLSSMPSAMPSTSSAANSTTMPAAPRLDWELF